MKANHIKISPFFSSVVLTVIIYIFSFNSLCAQTNQDSLFSKIKALNSQSLEALSDLADYYFKISDFENALLYYNTLRIATSHSDKFYYTKSLIGLGKVFQSTGNNDYSQKCFNLSIIIASENFDSLNLALAYNNLGNYYLDLRVKDSSMMYYQKAKLLFSALKDEQGLAGLENNIANFYFLQSYYSEAISHYQNSLKVANKLHFPQDQCIYHLNIGASYHKLNDTQNALFHYNKALEIAIDNNIKLGESRAYQELYFLYKERNDYNRALYFYEKFVDTENAIYNSQLTEKIASIESETKIKIAKNEIKYLTKDKEITEIKVKNRNYIITLFVLVLLLVISFIIIYIRRKKEKEQRLEYQITQEEYKNIIQLAENKLLIEKTQSKERELTTITVVNSNKNDLLESISKDLLRYQKSQKEDILKTIRTNIRESMDTELDWNTFKIHFEQVHPDFFNILKTDFPSLTHSNLRLCAYIKLGLNNKEIARLLHISSDSVKIAKKRLKKKLAIEPGEDFMF